MYEAFFGLSHRPFSAIPLVQQYYPAESIEQARQSLVRVVERAEGVGLVVGSAGTGKTLLCQALAEHFQDQLRVVLLTSARISTRRALLQSILFELKLPFRNLEEGEMRLALMDYLEPTESCPHGMLLILDEAHTVPARLLEEVRLLSNLVRHGEARVRLILAGSSLLEQRLAHPRLESFHQRIATRCYLLSFHRREVARYVRQVIDQAGGDSDSLLTDDALSAIARLTDGIPRLVNQLADHALLLAFMAKNRQIDVHQVEEAWADLQRLPAPTSTAPDNSVGAVIEFGMLDELPVDEPPVDESECEQVELPAAADAAETVELESENLEPAVGTEAAERTGAVMLEYMDDDPFGGPFAEEEEVVIERLGNWDTVLGVARPKVTGAASREMAEALAEVASPGAAESELNWDLPSFGPDKLETDDIDFPDSDEAGPVIALSQDGGVGEGRADELSVAVSVGLWSPPDLEGDDRDIILVEDDRVVEAAPTGRPQVSRQEYRHLFGRLRRPA
jgi:type II secretory pathway predicted ATPase ExeA